MDKTLILVKKYEDYLNRIFEMIKENRKKVCYVTFNKTPDFILESATKHNIQKDKFYFVDGITARIKSSSKVKNSIQINYFDNLSKISNDIKNIVNKGYSLVIFDSLSNILIYPSIDDSHIAKSLGVLFESLDKVNGEAAFVCSENDVGNYSLDKTIFLFNKFIKSSKLFGL
jgi:KaiC/GvpD/RAD55 family RecA-like ATPase